MARIAALVFDRNDRARLMEAVRGVAAVTFCDNPDELLELVASGAATLVLTELWDRTGTPIEPAIRRLTRDFPSVPFVLYLQLGEREVHTALQLAKMGASEIVLRGIDDFRLAITPVLAEGRARHVADEIIRAIDPLVPDELRSFFHLTATHAHRAFTVGDVSKALAIDRGTLRRRLRRARLPNPTHILGWMRLLHAAALLDEPGRSLHHIAAQLEFPSASVLGTQFQRYTLRTASSLRTLAAFHTVLQSFIDLLRRAENHTVLRP